MHIDGVGKEALDALDRLIDEADRWRAEHSKARRRIDAAAAAIRLRALFDARGAVEFAMFLAAAETPPDEGLTST